jgi:long-chain acyl-CoA synthetase
MVKWGLKPKIDEPWLKAYPKETPRQLDYEEITLDEMCRRNASKYPNADALFFEGTRISFSELDKLVDQFATALSKLGIRAKDVILIDTPNCPQYVIAFYAIMRIGAVANPIIPLNRYAEIVHQSNDSRAKMLIILDSLYEEHLHGKDLSKMATLETVIMTEIAEYLSPLKGKLGKLIKKIPYMKEWPTKVGKIQFRKFQEVLRSGLPINLPKVDIDPVKDTAVLIYTGGTTGAPKGVMSTHFNLIANCNQGISWVTTQVPSINKFRGKGGMIIVLPLSHSFAMSVGMNMAYWLGIKLILIPKPPEKLSKILDLALKEQAIFCPGVPTLWTKINQDPDSAKYKGKLTDFQACLSGAAPLPLEVRLKFEDITGAKIVEGYGMSEASPLLTANPFNDSQVNTVGFPVSDTFIKIMDLETGETPRPICPHCMPYCTENCGGDEQQYIGEICGSGPQIMKGYLNRQTDTEYALRKDKEGIIWYYTADIGCLDCNGYLHIKDRKRDMIKRRGHSVFPREVEDLLYQFEPILEVGVYGVKDPDPSVGEEIYAAVTLKPEFKDKTTVADIEKWAKENIAPYKYPREIQIVEELPKSLIGKILRRVLRDQETEKEK